VDTNGKEFSRTEVRFATRKVEAALREITDARRRLRDHAGDNDARELYVSLNILREQVMDWMDKAIRIRDRALDKARGE